MKVGFVGWRGMVGSVLLKRMQDEGDFNLIPDRLFFSTSQVGQKGPRPARGQPLKNADDPTDLQKCDIIVTCQGGNWTSKIYPRLRKNNWKGIWIDAASTLRLKKDSIIVLDPINRGMIESGLKRGIKNFIGGNCTVSLMLMACHGLLQRNLVEWINSTTYQAASGAGAANIQELVKQMGIATRGINPATGALELEKVITKRLRSSSFPVDNFGIPLAGSLIPWIDKAVEDGQTREEWKGFAEANKILGNKKNIPIDGICVRVGVMRCHSQALLIKLKNDIPINEIKDILAKANEWVKIIPNNKKETLSQLTPTAISGTLTIANGRLHKAKMGPNYLLVFTVGDQLLWGAAEPIRRTLKIIVENL